MERFRCDGPRLNGAEPRPSFFDMNYDPNLTNSGNMADQTVELTFQRWEYVTTRTTVVGGNSNGLSVIERAVENVFEELGGSAGEIRLAKPNGDVLICELWETELSEMLVGARIISIAPKSANSFR